MYAVNNDTVNQCMAEIGALKDAQIYLGAIQSLLRAHPDIEDVDTQQLADDIRRELGDREVAIARYCDPPEYEPEFTERYP